MFWRSAVALMAVLLTGACAGPSLEGGFDSGDPSVQLDAIRDAMRSDDINAAPHIVELLDADDPAVRMLAIAALQRLTGMTFDYRHADPPYLRREAIRRWVDALESGALARSAQTASKSIDDDE